MSDKVVYSAVKFKSSHCKDPETLCDVIYSEVKIGGSVPTHTVPVCEQTETLPTEKSRASALHYRLAAVCLSLLCAVLLIVIIVLCVSLTRANENFYAMEENLEHLRANYSLLVNEKNQLQENYSILIIVKEQVQGNCSSIAENRKLLQRNYNNLDKEYIQLQKNSSMLAEENNRLKENNSYLTADKEQLQKKYKTMSHKLPFMNKYCPSICKDSRRTPLSSELAKNLCESCPAAWIVFNSKCYYFSTMMQTWEESQQYCSNFGGHLVIIDSEMELDFINNHRSKQYWIGLTDVLQKRIWIWVDGTPLKDDGFWNIGKLYSDYYYGDCAYLHKGVWRKYCFWKLFWVCETEALL